MGGSVNRIVVLPIDMANAEEAKLMFDSIDVIESKCYLESDRQRLLGVIEHGFGDFTGFNDIVRHVFRERITLHLNT